MNKFDKYYLKQGKLELSLLDEEVNEDIEKATIYHEEESKETREPRIKLTEDIYNTLQTMGKFLTKKVDGEEDTYSQEGAEASDESENTHTKWHKVIKGESIHSTQAKQLEEAVRAMYVKAANEVEEISINVTKPVQILNEIPQEQKQTHQEERKSMVSLKDLVIFEDHQHCEEQLNQSSIDQILLEHFGDRKPQFEYIRRLKNHIDEKISLIENYQ